MALHRANARVTDRYGGTFIGRSVAALLAPPHGNALRGAVVIIASDGWDSDPPDVLVHALTRVRRRAELLVWLNLARHIRSSSRVPVRWRRRCPIATCSCRRTRWPACTSCCWRWPVPASRVRPSPQLGVALCYKL